MPTSPDIRETLLVELTAKLTASLVDAAARGIKDPRDPESVSLVVEAWHKALFNYHTELLSNFSRSTQSEQKQGLPHGTFVLSLADALQANQTADYLALCIVNENRTSLGWPPLDEAAAQSMRRARREQWAQELEAAYRSRREELDVQRLTFEQRDEVRDKFWSEIYAGLLQSAVQQSSK